MEKNMQKDKQLARIATSKETAVVKIKPEGEEIRPTVDAATMRRLPWTDLDAVIDSTI